MLTRRKTTFSRWANVVGWLVAAFSHSQSLAQDVGANEQPPNIVLLVADDLGYGELGCQGNLQIPTPHIDQLASSGVRCTQAYVTAPNCSPSRAGLFTGRIPTRFGYEFNPIGARNEDLGTGLPVAQRTLPEIMQEAGYSTGLVGKWHLGGAADYHPLRHGFDSFFGFLHEGHFFVPPPWAGVTSMLRRRTLPRKSGPRIEVASNLFYSSHMGHNEPSYDANNPILRGSQPVQENAYLTDAFTREAIAFIDQYQRTPFLLCVTYNAVHSPLQAKNETLQAFSHIEDLHRRIFAAMLSDLDGSVGQIMNALEERDLRRKTLIFFLSDNGGPTKELTSSNLPLRDGKGSMYEGGLRVPMIVNWQGRLPAGRVCEQVVSSLDILPTVKAAVDDSQGSKPQNPPGGAKLLPSGNDDLDGFDIMPLLVQESTQSPHERLFWRQGQRAALRAGSWKIVSPRKQNGVAIWELYNLDSDIGETRNLAAEQPQRLRELVAAWEAMNAEMADPAF